MVEIRVRDHGIGISAADQRNLFRKFFRADARMTRGIRGIGLGLYLTRGFVTAMGGRIRVESEEGKGSTFIVDLPLRRGSGGGVRGRMKVLVVDDEATIRLLCRVNLEAAGFAVFEVRTRAEVLPGGARSSAGRDPARPDAARRRPARRVGGGARPARRSRGGRRCRSCSSPPAPTCAARRSRRSPARSAT